MSPASDYLVGADDADAPSVEVTVGPNGVETTPILDDYFFLPGRAGGQVAHGGVAASETLELHATINSVKGVVKLYGDPVQCVVEASLTSARTAISVGGDGAVTLDAGGGIRALVLGGAYTIAGNPAGASFLVFNFNTAITLDNNAATNLNNPSIYRVSGTVNLTTAVAYGSIGTTDGRAFSDQISFVDGPGGATATVTAWSSFVQFLNVGSGWTFTTLRGHWVRNPTGTGTITTHVAFDIEALTRATTNLSMRSAGTDVEMRHAGPAVFGANAAPSNASVGLEVQSTTRAFLLPRMTTAQRDALTALDGMLIYNTTTAQAEKRDAGAWVAM